MPAKLVRIVGNLGNGKIRREKLHGRPYIVAPASIMAEGVLNGSRGPGFYPADEIKESTSGWDHKPIVAYHPEEDGDMVSACNADVLNAQQVGIMLHTVYDDKLRPECWFDEELTRKVDDRIIANLEKEEPLECSTGLRLKEVKEKGVYNNRKYNWIGKNFKPDHLAILPDKKGAYSIEDGGGVLVNTEGLSKDVAPILTRSVENALKGIRVDLVDNELSFQEISSQLCDLIRQTVGEPGKEWYGWLEAVYSDPNYVVYCAGGEYWQLDYTQKADVVQLAGEPVKVNRTITYVVANAAATTPPPENNMDKDKLIANLIGHGYEESDRAWLTKLEPDALAKIKPVKTETAVAANAGGNSGGDDDGATKKKKVTTNEEESATTPRNQKAATLDDMIANAGGPQSEGGKMLKRMASTFLRQRKKNVETIKKNSKMSDEVLANMDDEALEAIAEEFSGREASAVSPFGGFFGAAGSVVGNVGGEDEETPLAMPNYGANAAK